MSAPRRITLRAIEPAESSGRPLHARLGASVRRPRGVISQGQPSRPRGQELRAGRGPHAARWRPAHRSAGPDHRTVHRLADRARSIPRCAAALQVLLRIMTRKYGDNQSRARPDAPAHRSLVHAGRPSTTRRDVRCGARWNSWWQAKARSRRSSSARSPHWRQCNRRQLMDPDQQLLSAPDAERATLYHDPTTRPPRSPSRPRRCPPKASVRCCARPRSPTNARTRHRCRWPTYARNWATGTRSASCPSARYPTTSRHGPRARASSRRPEGKPVVEALFGKPLLLQVFRPDGWDRYASRPPEEVETRNVVVEFDRECRRRRRATQGPRRFGRSEARGENRPRH